MQLASRRRVRRRTGPTPPYTNLAPQRRTQAVGGWAKEQTLSTPSPCPKMAMDMCKQKYKHSTTEVCGYTPTAVHDEQTL